MLASDKEPASSNDKAARRLDKTYTETKCNTLLASPSSLLGVSSLLANGGHDGHMNRGNCSGASRSRVARSARLCGSKVGTEGSVLAHVVAGGPHHVVQVGQTGDLVAGTVCAIVGARCVTRSAVIAQIILSCKLEQALPHHYAAIIYLLRKAVVVKRNHSDRGAVAQRNTRASQILRLRGHESAVGVAVERQSVDGSAIVAAISVADVDAVRAARCHSVARQTAIVPERSSCHGTREVASPRRRAALSWTRNEKNVDRRDGKKEISA